MSTSALTVRCQSCGAPLQIAGDIRFLTCNYCKAELELVRDTSATHTRVLEKIQADTQQMRNHLKVLDLQNEIERLDRDWEAWRQENLTQRVSGEYFEPTRLTASILPILILIFGCLLAITLQGLLAVLLVMVVTLCLSGCLLRLLLDTSHRYATAKRRYKDLRQQLLFRLKQERQQAE